MAQYSTENGDGRVSVVFDTGESSSVIVIGHDTTWIDDGVAQGDIILIGTDTVFYTISLVEAITGGGERLWLTAAYPMEKSYERYTLCTDFTLNYNLVVLNLGDLNSAEILTRNFLALDNDLYNQQVANVSQGFYLIGEPDVTAGVGKPSAILYYPQFSDDVESMTVERLTLFCETSYDLSGSGVTEVEICSESDFATSGATTIKAQLTNTAAETDYFASGTGSITIDLTAGNRIYARVNSCVGHANINCVVHSA